MKGPTTAKELFANQIADMIRKEQRRRKTGRHVVLRHVVSIVNDMHFDALPGCQFYYGMKERDR